MIGPSPRLFRAGYVSVHHCQNTCLKNDLLHTSVWEPRLSALHGASIFTAFVIFSTIHITAAFVTAGPVVIHIVRVWWALTIDKIINLFQWGKLKSNKDCWLRTSTVTFVRLDDKKYVASSQPIWCKLILKSFYSQAWRKLFLQLEASLQIKGYI